MRIEEERQLLIYFRSYRNIVIPVHSFPVGFGKIKCTFPPLRSLSLGECNDRTLSDTIHIINRGKHKTYIRHKTRLCLTDAHDPDTKTKRIGYI